MGQTPTPQNAVNQELSVANILSMTSPLQLNEVLPLSELNQAPVSELQARGIHFALGQLTNADRELWYKILPGSSVDSKIEFQTYFRKPFPHAQLVVHVFGVNKDGKFDMGRRWVTQGAPGSSVAHGTSGMSLRTIRIVKDIPTDPFTPTVLFRIALVGNHPAPAHPFVFFATKTQA
ncbi:MAG: hypothetical protein IPK16_09990 [Anaerolineales bacterium]|nr:hypothetical protein [Anaerolineales bacterium]